MNDIINDWNQTASAYEAFNAAEDSYSYNIEWPCILRMLPNLHQKRVLDLGCGTGIFTFLLEQSGPAEIVGLDASCEMLKIAQKKAQERHSRARFVSGDAAHAADSVSGRFDLVFSSTTSHYIADLNALFASIRRCLNPDGTCILSVIHPVYSAMYPIEHGGQFPADDEWVVRYLDKRMRAYIQPWIEYNDQVENRLSTSFHYTFSDYVNAITAAGLTIREAREPLPPESWKAAFPSRYESFIETPTYLIFRLDAQ